MSNMWMEKEVDRESHEKLYIQVYSLLKKKIEKGNWPVNTQIPTEDELCKLFDVSKATVRLAIIELVKEGYLKRQQGKGTFVACIAPQTGIMMKTALTEDLTEDLTEGIIAERRKVETEILSKEVMSPPEEMKIYFSSKDVVYLIRYKGSVSGSPTYIEDLFVPMTVFPRIEDEDFCKSILPELIHEKVTKNIYKVIQNIEVTKLEGSFADILEVSEGTPALLIVQILIDSGGNLVVFRRLIEKVGRYKVQIELERVR